MILCLSLSAAAENVLWIESENTMGVHRSKVSEAGLENDRVIPVPWTRLWSPECASTNSITISNFVSVASFSDNDMMKYFDTTDQVFKIWQRNGSTWGHIEDMHWSERGEPASALFADTKLLDRGLGLWLRIANGGDVYLIGQSSTNAPVSVMAAANQYEDKPNVYTENFVVNPCDTDVDLLQLGLSNAVIGDEINVVTPTNSVLYWYKVPTGATDGKAEWCKLGKTVVEQGAPWNQSIKIKVEVLGYTKCDTLLVPYGAGVWYSCVTNAPHDPPPEIHWGHQEEFRQ